MNDLTPMQAWRAEAACAPPDPIAGEVDEHALSRPGMDPAWWVVPNGTRAAEPSEENLMAMAVCSGCPVREECLADANRMQDSHTIRGGLMPGDDGRVVTIPR